MSYRHLLRRLGSTMALALATATAAEAQSIYQTVNSGFQPGPGRLAFTNIGWYWTPATNVTLLAVQTQLASDPSQFIDNDFTLTTTLYTERPVAGGVALGSSSANANTGGWIGNAFAAPISLVGGTTYFLGFGGWNPLALAGGGVNYVGHSTAEPGYETAESFGTAYFDAAYTAYFMNPVPPATFNLPVLRFVQQDAISAVPEPATVLLVAPAMAALWLARRRTRS